MIILTHYDANKLVHDQQLWNSEDWPNRSSSKYVMSYDYCHKACVSSYNYDCTALQVHYHALGVSP